MPGEILSGAYKAIEVAFPTTEQSQTQDKDSYHSEEITLTFSLRKVLIPALIAVIFDRDSSSLDLLKV